MRVKELIEILSKLDQEKEIRIMIGYDGISDEPIENIILEDCFNENHEREKMYTIN